MLYLSKHKRRRWGSQWLGLVLICSSQISAVSARTFILTNRQPEPKIASRPLHLSLRGCGSRVTASSIAPGTLALPAFAVCALSGASPYAGAQHQHRLGAKKGEEA